MNQVVVLIRLTSLGVDKCAGRVQVEDDFVHEGTDVSAAHAAHPHAPVQRQRAAQRRTPRLARVPHLQPYADAHLVQIYSPRLIIWDSIVNFYCPTKTKFRWTSGGVGYTYIKLQSFCLGFLYCP